MSVNNKPMTYKQLDKLRDDLAKLYERHHAQLTATEENSISIVREFIYLEMEGAE